jgi:hypothetical protein
MSPEPTLLAALLATTVLVAVPAFGAWHRRRSSRDASEIAMSLQAFALIVQREGRCLPLEAALLARVENLRRRVPEIAAFLLTQHVPRLTPELLSEAAQRLALRLKRRVAFERKMLARTTSGLRRGAVAAAVPPLALLGLTALGTRFSGGALLCLLLVEAFGCCLLWRAARVEV